jgi:WD40 repeat protein
MNNNAKKSTFSPFIQTKIPTKTIDGNEIEFSIETFDYLINSKDNELLVSGGSQQIAFWSMVDTNETNNSPLNHIEINENHIIRHISSSQNFLVVASETYGEHTAFQVVGSISIYNTSTLQKECDWNVGSGIFCSKFNSKGNLLACGDQIGTVMMHSVNDKWSLLYTIQLYNCPVRDFCFVNMGKNHDTTRLYCAGQVSDMGGMNENAISLHAVEVLSGTILFPFHGEEEIHLDAFSIVHSSQFGMFSSSGHGNIARWDDENGKFINKISGAHQHFGIWSLDISPDEILLASGGKDGYVRIWSLPDLEIVNLFLHGRKESHVMMVRFNVSGERLISIGQNIIQVWLAYS